jgi:hypothetical protein
VFARVTVTASDVDASAALHYGGFLLDPDGNSAETVHHGAPRTEHTALAFRAAAPGAAGRRTDPDGHEVELGP